jgi:hypothetical protein
VYDEIDGANTGQVDTATRLRVTTPNTRSAERSKVIMPLLAQGKTALEIRTMLGLTRVQYHRALAKHAANAGMPPQQALTKPTRSRTDKARIAVRHLLNAHALTPENRLQLSIHFGFRSRSSLDKIIREERERTDNDGRS